VTVVNDAYNANPESVAAALHTLATMAGPDRRGWAVLGPLGELGAAEAGAHREIGVLAARLGVERLVVVGQQAEPMLRGADEEGGGAGSSAVLVPDVAAALDLLRAELAPGDVVLIKASRAFGLERIAEGLLGPDPQERGRR
jgi:UDP-N-acetylmuramoyl-tripeptide--D-alanyl-D-alanine ligase